MSLPYTTNFNALDGITSSTVSEPIDLSKRQQATVVFTCSSYTSGDANFTIDASNDGTYWVTSIACRDATSTAPTTFVTNTVVGSATSKAVVLTMGFRYYRISGDVTGSGTYYAVIEAAG